MVVVALLSVDLVESVDLVSVYLVVNCIKNWLSLCFYQSVDPATTQFQSKFDFLHHLAIQI